MEVRPLVREDAAGLLPLLEGLGWCTDDDRATRRIDRLVGHPDCHGWVAVDRTLVGFATGQLNWMLQLDAPVAELTGLAVLPDAACAGAGTRLLAAFEGWALEAGAWRLKITSGSHRPEAHRFYERRGYEPSGTRFHKIVRDASTSPSRGTVPAVPPRARIRDATRSDVPAVVALLADDELGRHRESASLPLDEGYWDAFEAIDADPNHRLVVLEMDDGEIGGCLQLSLLPYLTFRGGWRAQIEAVRVASDRRGAGLGHVLFDWAIGEARRHACHLVQLTTNAQRPDAMAFYESLGFHATHQGMKLYLDGDVTGR